MHEEIFAIAKHYGDDCSNCKEVCCANMALDINRDELKKMAKLLKMDHTEFRKKYTVLFRSMFKGSKFETFSKEAKAQLNKNPRLLKFEEVDPKEIDLPKEQLDRLIDFKKQFKKGADKDIKILICPFYDKDTHRCKVHKSRPGACYLYPFNYSVEPGQIDFRKVNACILSTNFLKRLLEFMEKMNLPKDVLNETLESKEYMNHFYVPAMLVYTYLIWECDKLGIKLKDENLKKLKVNIISEMIKK